MSISSHASAPRSIYALPLPRARVSHTPLLRPASTVNTCQGFVFTPVYAPYQDPHAAPNNPSPAAASGGRSAFNYAAEAHKSSPYGVSILYHGTSSRTSSQLCLADALRSSSSNLEEGMRAVQQTEWIIGGHENPVQAIAAVEIRRPNPNYNPHSGDGDGNEIDGNNEDDGEEDAYGDDPDFAASPAASSNSPIVSDILFVTSSSDSLILWCLSEVLSCFSSDPQHTSQPTGRVLPHSYDGVYRMEMDASGSMLSVCTSNNGAVIIELESGQVEAVLEGHNGRINGASFMPQSYVEQFQLGGGGEWPSTAGASSAVSLSPSAAPSHVITYGQDRTFKVWDLTARCMVYTSSIVSPSPFTTLAWESSLPRFVLGSEDGKIRHYDVGKIAQAFANANPNSPQAQSAAAVASVRLIHTMDVCALQRRLLKTHENAEEEKKRKRDAAAAQGKVIRANASSSAAPEPLYKPYLATEANARALGYNVDAGENDISFSEEEDALDSILALYFPLYSPAVPVTSSQSLQDAPTVALSSSVPQPKRSPASSPQRSPNASPKASPASSPVSIASLSLSPTSVSNGIGSDILYVVTSRSLVRVNTRTYELEWVGAFNGGDSHAEDASASDEGIDAVVSSNVSGLALLPGVGLSNQASFLELPAVASSSSSDADGDAAGSEHELFVVASSPFIGMLHLLSLSTSPSSDASLLAASLPSITQNAPLSRGSALKSWAWVLPAPPAKKKNAMPTKKGVKPGQIGAPTSHNIVFHTRIKSSGYGPASSSTSSSKGPKQLNLGRLHQKANSTAGRAFLAQQKKSSSAASSSSSSSAEKQYPLDCGLINTLSPLYGVAAKTPALHNAPIISLNFSSDAKRLLTASLDCTAASVRCPPWKHPQGITHMLGHKKPLRAAAWAWVNPQAKVDEPPMLLTSSNDGTARLWQLGRADPLLVFDRLKRNEPPDSVAAAAAASGIAAANAAASSDSNPLFTAEIPMCSFFRQNQLIALCHRNQLLLYKYYIDPAKTNTDLKKLQNLNKYKLLTSYSENGAQSLTTFACLNTAMSTLIFLADSGRNLHLLDASVGKLVRTVPDAHAKSIHCISLRQSYAEEADAQQLFATVATDSAVKLWDVRSKDCIRRFSGHVNRSAHIRANFSPCHRYLAVGSEDNRAYVFDLRNGNIVDKLAGATDVVSDVLYHPATPQIVTSCYDGRIRFYTEK